MISNSITKTPIAHILRYDSAHQYYRTAEYELKRTSGALASLDFHENLSAQV